MSHWTIASPSILHTIRSTGWVEIRRSTPDRRRMRPARDGSRATFERKLCTGAPSRSTGSEEYRRRRADLPSPRMSPVASTSPRGDAATRREDLLSRV